MRRNSVDVITLGCSKNLVDSERLIRQLQAKGLTVRHDPKVPASEYVVINTCGFIGDAQEESVETILECCDLKKRGKVGKVFVMGCLSEKYMDELNTEIPEVDRYTGKFDWHELLPLMNASWNKEIAHERTVTTPSHYAYLKIAEGCNRKCSYCAIPLMTGPYHSRSEEDILKEAEWLVANGARELQLIAQDITYYGRDMGNGKACIADLVRRISDIEGVDWIRLHYGYPNSFPMDLLKVMRERDNVCKYLDIAFQHISDSVLKRMHRNFTAGQTRELIAAIRSEVPGIHLRTTLMTGFPGETEADFDALMQFVRETRFERMGAFAYCEVDGTYSALHYRDDVPPEVKQARLSRLMRLQQSISEEISSEKVGKVFKTIIDRKEGNYYIGRTQFDSPEVDPEMLISTDHRLRYGRFYDVKVTDAQEFDLYGTIE